MCELFGISAKDKIRANEMLKTFFSHSQEHKNGWGLALLDDDSSSIDKEPIREEKCPLPSGLLWRVRGCI